MSIIYILNRNSKNALHSHTNIYSSHKHRRVWVERRNTLFETKCEKSLGYRKLRWEMHRNLEQNGDKSGLNCGINVLPVWRLGLADRILVMLVPVLQLLARLLLQLVLLQFFLAIFLLQTGLLVFTPLPYLFGFFANDRSGCVSFRSGVRK